MKRKYFVQSLRYLLIILWMYAALSKLLDYPLFIAQLNKQPIPKGWLSTLAVTIPMVEICAAILLAFQRTKTLGFKVSFILMSLFTLYVALAMARVFGHIPCACAGIIGRMPWLPHLVFNIFFTIISYAGLYLHKHKDINNKTVPKKLFANNRQTT